MSPSAIRPVDSPSRADSISEQERKLELFGTHVRLLAAVPAFEAGGPEPLLPIAALMGLMHRTLTRFDPESELNRLPTVDARPRLTSEILLRALAAALWAAEWSDGLVDPTLAADLERAGYASSRAAATSAPLPAALAAAPPRRSARPRPERRWRSIGLDPGAGTASVPNRLRLDLGGTAKGLAADLAAARLGGSATFAVDVGGDIRLGGTAGGTRMVEIVNPLAGRATHHFPLAVGAVATSGLGARLWRTAEGFAHHILDPASGRPAWTGVVQATALAPTALEAEARAKVALLLGPRKGRRLLERDGGVLVLDEGAVVAAGRLREDLRPLS